MGLGTIRVRLGLLRRKHSAPSSAAVEESCCPIAEHFFRKMTAMACTNTVLFSSHTHAKHSAACAGFHSSLFRHRPTLRLHRAIRESSFNVEGVSIHGCRISCQQGRQLQRRSSPPSNLLPEACSDKEVQPVPAWQKLASFLLKSTALVALALALVGLAESLRQAVRCNTAHHHGAEFP